MPSKLVIVLLLTLFALSLFKLTLSSEGHVKAQGWWTTSSTIYINADGSVSPSNAPISRSGNVYTLTMNIESSVSSTAIVIRRGNIVFNGNGYTLRLTASGSCGISVDSVSNVTITNIVIEATSVALNYGIELYYASSCTIYNNVLRTLHTAISIYYGSGNNRIIWNNIYNVRRGFRIDYSSNNVFLYNSVSVIFYTGGSVNYPVTISGTGANTWDDGEIGNYWYWAYAWCSDNNEDGVCDQSYTINSNNVDRRQLVFPITSAGSGPIFIKSNGTVLPYNAPIVRQGNVYMLTSNILTRSGIGIVVRRSNIVINGNGYWIRSNRTGYWLMSGIRVVNGVSNVTVANILVQDFHRAAFVTGASSVVFSNTVMRSYWGIWAENVNNLRVVNSVINATSDSSIYISGSTGIRITDSTIYSVDKVSYIRASNVTVDRNLFIRESLEIDPSSSNVNITNNAFVNSGIIIYNDRVRLNNNTANGKPIVYLNGASNVVIRNASQVFIFNSFNAHVDGIKTSNVPLAILVYNSTWVTVTSSSIESNKICIYINKSRYMLIDGSNINCSGDYGITILNSMYVSVTNNVMNITSLYYGINVVGSSDIYIYNNDITTGAEYGIYLENSSSTEIENNKIYSIYEYNIGIYIEDTSDVTVKGNIIDNAWTSIYIYYSFSLQIIDNYMIFAYTGIDVYDSNNITLSGNFIYGSGYVGYGVKVQYSNNVTMTWNKIKDIEYGIYVYMSYISISWNDISYASESCIYLYLVYDNEFKFNNISFCYIGVRMSSSYNNSFLYNNFMYNNMNVYYEDYYYGGEINLNGNNGETGSSSRINIWDDGKYGNYWSNHVCYDSDNDMVCDMPYIVYAPYDIDYRPLAYPSYIVFKPPTPTTTTYIPTLTPTKTATGNNVVTWLPRLPTFAMDQPKLHAPSLDSPESLLSFSLLVGLFIFLVTRVRWTQALFITMVVMSVMSMSVYRSPPLFVFGVLMSVIAIVLDKNLS